MSSDITSNNNCSFCDKVYSTLEDLITHIPLEHHPIPSKALVLSTIARENKKSLGNFMGDESKKGIILECPECFEPFSKLDQLNKHRKNFHNMLLTPQAAKKMKNFTGEKQPQCERCYLYFITVIATKIELKTQFVCMNCYEKYWGVNALLRLTIGTPNDVLDKIRKPVSIHNKD